MQEGQLWILYFSAFLYESVRNDSSPHLLEAPEPPRVWQQKLAQGDKAYNLLFLLHANLKKVSKSKVSIIMSAIHLQGTIMIDIFVLIWRSAYLVS